MMYMYDMFTTIDHDHDVQCTFMASLIVMVSMCFGDGVDFCCCFDLIVVVLTMMVIMMVMMTVIRWWSLMLTLLFHFFSVTLE